MAMSEEMLVRHCSPTLAGIKTGSMFGCYFHDKRAVYESVRCWDRRLRGKGLRVVLLRYGDARALIYVYRPLHLLRDLQNDTARRLLCERGYGSAVTRHCVHQLKRRMRKCEEFPHEVGLFLGYPPEDVRGFIEDRESCKCCGCWKVYGDVTAAKAVFAKYKKCTAIYCAQLARGRSVEQLAVAV